MENDAKTETVHTVQGVLAVLIKCRKQESSKKAKNKYIGVSLCFV